MSKMVLLNYLRSTTTTTTENAPKTVNFCEYLLRTANRKGDQLYSSAVRTVCSTGWSPGENTENDR